MHFADGMASAPQVGVGRPGNGIRSPYGSERSEHFADLEEKYGFRSAWNVPLKQFPIYWKRPDKFRARGFGLGVHGLSHEGELFGSLSEFGRLSRFMEQLAHEPGLRGLRSPSRFRKAEWIDTMGFDYDCSFPQLLRQRPLRAVTRRLLMWDERASARLAGRVLAVHHPHRLRLERAGIPADKIKVVMNSPDPAIFKQRSREYCNGADLTMPCHGTMARHPERISSPACHALQAHARRHCFRLGWRCSQAGSLCPISPFAFFTGPLRGGRDRWWE